MPDFDFDQDLPDTEEEVKEEEIEDAGTEAEVEQKALAMAEEMFKNHMYSLSLEDPEYAASLRRKYGIETTSEPQKATPPAAKPEDKKSSIPSDVARSLEELKKDHSRQIDALRWERDQEKFETFFEEDDSFSGMPPELVGDLMRTALQGYAIDLSNNPKSSPKTYLKNFKKVIGGIQNFGVNTYLKKRKQSNNVPVSPMDIISGIRKEEDFKPSKDALRNGEVRKQMTKMLKKMGFQ